MVLNLAHQRIHRGGFLKIHAVRFGNGGCRHIAVVHKDLADFCACHSLENNRKVALRVLNHVLDRCQNTNAEEVCGLRLVHGEILLRHEKYARIGCGRRFRKGLEREASRQLNVQLHAGETDDAAQRDQRERHLGKYFNGFSVLFFVCHSHILLYFCKRKSAFLQPFSQCCFQYNSIA